jgi:hypothetical protein
MPRHAVREIVDTVRLSQYAATNYEFVDDDFGVSEGRARPVPELSHSGYQKPGFDRTTIARRFGPGLWATQQTQDHLWSISRRPPPIILSAHRCNLGSSEWAPGILF